MKKEVLFGGVLTGVLLFTGCEDPVSNNNQGNGTTNEVTYDVLQSGIWLYRGMQYTLDLVDEAVLYDAENDEYHNGNFVEFDTDSTVQFYSHRDSSMSGYDTCSREYALNGTQLTGLESYFESENITVSIINGNLHLSTAIEYDNGGSGNMDYIYALYTGIFPVPTWESGPAKDIYEPNNDFDSATEIDLNTKYPVTLSRPDVDWYSFPVEEGKRYLVSFYWPRHMDYPSLNLYDSTPTGEFGDQFPSESIDPNSQLREEYPDSRRIFTATSSRELYLFIDGGDWANEGAYTLEIIEIVQ